MKTTVQCPICSARSANNLSNPQLWRSKFRCKRCGAEMSGKYLFAGRIKTAPGSSWTSLRSKVFSCGGMGPPVTSGARFAVYEVVDPRTGIPFWVGAGLRDRWMKSAMRIESEGKEKWFIEIRKAGFEPLPRIVAFFADRLSAMVLKFELCKSIGQAFRGGKLNSVVRLPGDRRVGYKRSHGGGKLSPPRPIIVIREIIDCA